MSEARRISIGVRLAVLVSALLVALLATVGAAVLLQRQAHAVLASVYADRLVPMARLKSVADAYAVDVADAVQKVRDGTMHGESAATVVEAARAAADRQWRAYLAAAVMPGEKALIDEAAAHRLRADGSAARAAAMMAAGDRAALSRFAAIELYPAVEPLSQAVAKLIALQQSVAEAELQQHLARSGRQSALLVAVALAVSLAAAWGSWRIVRSVTRPLGQAVQMAEAVAKGALQTRITSERHDEIGQLLVAVDRMRGTLVDLVDTDQLTGLMTRRRFDELVHAECLRAQRQGQPWSVLMIDLDRFKQVNDTYGHAGGDAALRAVAEALRQALRVQDSAARRGGEEMAVLLPGADNAVALQVGERVRQAVARLVVPHGEHQIRLSASVGVAAWAREPAHDAQRVIERADEALYAAKEGGRNRVVSHDALVAAAGIIRDAAEH